MKYKFDYVRRGKGTFVMNIRDVSDKEVTEQVLSDWLNQDIELERAR